MGETSVPVQQHCPEKLPENPDKSSDNSSNRSEAACGSHSPIFIRDTPGTRAPHLPVLGRLTVARSHDGRVRRRERIPRLGMRRRWESLSCLPKGKVRIIAKEHQGKAGGGYRDSTAIRTRVALDGGHVEISLEPSVHLERRPEGLTCPMHRVRVVADAVGGEVFDADTPWYAACWDG